MYPRSSTNPENLAKIGQVVFEIIGLTEIVKKVKYILRHRQNISPPSPGRANDKRRCVRCLVRSVQVNEYAELFSTVRRSASLTIRVSQC